MADKTFQFDFFESKAERLERQEQKKISNGFNLKEASRLMRDKTFIGLNCCPHCGAKIWRD
jgi:hypothetical protein